MLKKKYLVTPLYSPEEREPLEVMPARAPSFFRFAWILRNVLYLTYRYYRLRFSREYDEKEWAWEIRHFVEIMGGVWMKAGQVLAMRSDLFSLEFCNELARLQDQAYAFPSQDAMQLIGESLGKPIDEVFEDFEEMPFAAASLSQVHRARFACTRIWVVIKVQRPHAMEAFRYDMWWLSRLFGILQFFDIMNHCRWAEMLVEIRSMMEEELDYRQEASSMRQLKKLLKPHKVYVPKVFLDTSTDKVLVMEFIQGVFMSEYVQAGRNEPDRLQQWLDDNEIQPKKVGKRLFSSQLRQIYEDLLFHGDLHPGNIVLLRKNRLAFVDFGNVGRIDREFASKYSHYLRAFARGEMSTAADLYLVLAGQLSPTVDIARVKHDLIKAFQRHQVRSQLKNLPFQERSLAGNAAELSAVASKYKFEINWNLLKVGRALGAIDQNLGVLYPEVDYNKETQKYINAKARREGESERLSKVIPELVGRISDLTTVMMPTLMGKAMQFGGAVSSGKRTLTFIIRWFTRFFWVGLVALLWAYIYQHHPTFVDHPEDWLVLGTNLHDDNSTVARWFESLPRLSRAAWFAIMGLVVLVNMRLIVAIKDLLTPTAKLPGEAPHSR